MTKKTEQIAGILVSIVILIIIGYKSIPNLLKNWEASNALSKYSTEIEACVKEKEGIEKDQKQSELKYSCAMEAATNAYKTNKEEAINLCLQYSSVSKIATGTGYNEAQEKNWERMSCESIIQNKIKEKNQ